MGLLNKLMFWKKDDDLDFDKIAEREMGQDLSMDFSRDDLGLNEQPLSTEKSPFEESPAELPPHLQESNRGTAYPQSRQDRATALRTPQYAGQQQSFRQQPSGYPSEQREMELISSKLDTIKAIMSSLDQRMSNLEQAAGIKKQKDKLW